MKNAAAARAHKAGDASDDAGLVSPGVMLAATSSKRTILFVTTEMSDCVKVGGLGEVSAALPRALASHFDVRVIIPGYPQVLARHRNLTIVGEIDAHAKMPACRSGTLRAGRHALWRLHGRRLVRQSHSLRAPLIRCRRGCAGPGRRVLVRRSGALQRLAIRVDARIHALERARGAQRAHRAQSRLSGPVSPQPDR